jgi:hypothetical protein
MIARLRMSVRAAMSNDDRTADDGQAPGTASQQLHNLGQARHKMPRGASPVSDIRDPFEAERLAAVAPQELHTRRDFLQRTAVTAGLSAGLGLVLDPDTVIAAAARTQRQVALPSPRNLPIDTFVVLMMENRSFDHYLGWLPGADGRQAGLRFTDAHGRTFATHRLVNNFQGCGFLDPDHSWQGGRTEMDGGRMDGFLRAQSDVFSIGYYAEQDLPFTRPRHHNPPAHSASAGAAGALPTGCHRRRPPADAPGAKRGRRARGPGDQLPDRLTSRRLRAPLGILRSARPERLLRCPAPYPGPRRLSA